MVGIKQLFSPGRVSRRAFWAGWAAHFVVAFALAALWRWVQSISGEQLATLIVGMLRAFVIVPQIMMYVGRLKDAGRSGKEVFVLITLYAVVAGFAAFWADDATDAARQCAAGFYDSCDDFVSGLLAVALAYGPLTGLPDPFSLLCALGVGTLKGVEPAEPVKAK